MGSLQLQDFAAGWVGGAASVVVGHPLDTIKTRLQAGQGYGNTLNCVLTVYRNESVAGFFKGMSFPLASIAVYSSVVFGVFSNTQRLLSQLRHGDPSRTPALADVALASMVAGFISVGIGTPVDLVKIRLQMQMQPYIKANIKLKPTVPGFPVYRGPIHCFRTVLQKEGIAGIYRGAGAMLLRDVPGYCLYFIPYTYFCGWITPDGCISPNPSSIWLAGGIAGPGPLAPRLRFMT
ncbi:solute carrier family 25 member 48 [Grus japonensis]|uniref:Solute carrier family 25 member 48 n=1 Tax=Grus japonensis TaxID=30415 RepID=A0ABC9XFE7_GRUJA